MFAPLFVPQETPPPENQGWFTARSLPVVSVNAAEAAEKGRFFPIFEAREGIDTTLKILHFPDASDAIAAVARFCDDRRALLATARRVVEALLVNPDICLLINEEVAGMKDCDDERYLAAQDFMSDMLCAAAAPDFSCADRLRYSGVPVDETLRAAFRNAVPGSKIVKGFCEKAESLAAQMVETLPPQFICDIFKILLPEEEKQKIARATLKKFWRQIAPAYDKCTFSGFMIGKSGDIGYRCDVRQEWIDSSARPFDLQRYARSGPHPLRMYFVRYDADRKEFSSPLSEWVSTAINTECARRLDYSRRQQRQSMGGV